MFSYLLFCLVRVSSMCYFIFFSFFCLSIVFSFCFNMSLKMGLPLFVFQCFPFVVFLLFYSLCFIFFIFYCFILFYVYLLFLIPCFVVFYYMFIFSIFLFFNKFSNCFCMFSIPFYNVLLCVSNVSFILFIFVKLFSFFFKSHVSIIST